MYHSNIEHLFLLLYNAPIIDWFLINYLKPKYSVCNSRFLLAQITNSKLVVKLQANYRINYTNTLRFGETKLVTP